MKLVLEHFHQVKAPQFFQPFAPPGPVNEETNIDSPTSSLPQENQTEGEQFQNVQSIDQFITEPDFDEFPDSPDTVEDEETFLAPNAGSPLFVLSDEEL